MEEKDLEAGKAYLRELMSGSDSDEGRRIMTPVTTALIVLEGNVMPD
jgi:hypothetical protein